MTQYFADANGKYLGGFDGATPPAGAVETPVPENGNQIWNGSAWTTPKAIDDDIKEDKKRSNLGKSGITLEDIVMALFEKEKGDSKSFDEIDAIINP